MIAILSATLAQAATNKTVTLQGGKVKLAGNAINVGDTAPIQI